MYMQSEEEVRLSLVTHWHLVGFTFLNLLAQAQTKDHFSALLDRPYVLYHVLGFELQPKDNPYHSFQPWVKTGNGALKPMGETKCHKEDCLSWLDRRIRIEYPSHSNVNIYKS